MATDRGAYIAQLPATPSSLTSPANGATNVLSCELTPFTWSAAAGATSYEIQIDNNSNFASPETTGTSSTTSFNHDLQNCNTTYYWRVRSNATGFGKSPWSSSSSFTTQQCSPPTLAAPNLLSPSDNATNVPTNPTLSWEAVSGAIKYKVVVVGFTTQYTTNTSLQISGLSHSTWYSWNVTAVNCAVNPASSTWDFQTCASCEDGPEGGITVAGGETEEQVVREYALEQNYPNPFNPKTRFDFAIKEPGHVRLQVFNTLGQVVATLVDEYQSAGYKSVAYDASAVPSGVYFYRLTSGTFSSVKKMIFMK